MSTKRSYHSDFILQYKLGMLPANVVKQIPTSTRYYWNKTDYSKLFGRDFSVLDKDETIQYVKDYVTNKRLQKATKALYQIFQVYSKLMSRFSLTKNIAQSHQIDVVNVVEKTREEMGLKRVLKLLTISEHQYYAWKNNMKNCSTSIYSRCYKKYPQQLSSIEISSIKKYLTLDEYRYWSTTSIYYQMLRDGAAFMAKSTFFSYARRFNLLKYNKSKTKYDKGIRADAPKKILHMDVTVYRPADHSKVYIYVLMDNYSRYILNITASKEYSSNICLTNIKGAFRVFDFEPSSSTELICDGGPENKKHIDHYINERPGDLIKLVAKKNIRSSNSMVEAVNKRLKYDFLFRHPLENFEQTREYIKTAVEQYNNKPHSSLFGATPKEVFNGLIPNTNTFKNAIKNARIKRVLQNKRDACKDC